MFCNQQPYDDMSVCLENSEKAIKVIYNFLYKLEIRNSVQLSDVTRQTTLFSKNSILRAIWALVESSSSIKIDVKKNVINRHKLNRRNV